MRLHESLLCNCWTWRSYNEEQLQYFLLVFVRQQKEPAPVSVTHSSHLLHKLILFLFPPCLCKAAVEGMASTPACFSVGCPLQGRMPPRATPQCRNQALFSQAFSQHFPWHERSLLSVWQVGLYTANTRVTLEEERCWSWYMNTKNIWLYIKTGRSPHTSCPKVIFRGDKRGFRAWRT